jgi:hypothetical protein
MPAAMFMLNATNPDTIKLARAGMVGVGMKVQRIAHDLLKTFARKQTKSAASQHWCSAHQRANHSLHQQEDARWLAQENGACFAGH